MHELPHAFERIFDTVKSFKANKTVMRIISLELQGNYIMTTVIVKQQTGKL